MNLRQVGTVQHESEAKPVAMKGGQEICEPSLCRIAQRTVALRNDGETAGVNPHQADESNAALDSSFAPEPEAQGSKHDKGHEADPERYLVAANCHLHLEKNAKQLRNGDEPEHDRGDQRRRLPHLSILSPPL